MKKVLVLPGDGIGPEVISATVQAINILTDEIEFRTENIGLEYFREKGRAIPKSVINSITEYDAVLLGTISDAPEEKGYRNPDIELAHILNLQTSVRQIKSIHPELGNMGVNAIMVSNNVHMTFIQEMDDVDGIMREISMPFDICRKICEDAKLIALDSGRKKVTCIHGNHLFKNSDTKFMQIFYDVFSSSGLELENETVVDAVAKIASGKQDYDMIVTLELYSKIIGDALSAHMGGTYLTPIVDLGDDVAIFRPSHSENKQITSINYANPTASLLSGALMLEYFEMHDEAEILRDAVVSAYKRGYEPRDVGGEYGTFDFTDEIIKYCNNPM